MRARLGTTKMVLFILMLEIIYIRKNMVYMTIRRTGIKPTLISSFGLDHE